MKHISLLSAALLCLLFMPVSAPAKSATFGVYAVIDQVTFEPEGSAPATVQISGIFVIPLPNSSGAYQAPQRGYLSFQLRPGQEAQDQKDWTALKAYAGTGRVVGFGDYWVFDPSNPCDCMHRVAEIHVHPGGEAASPDIYLPPYRGIQTTGGAADRNFDGIAAQLLQAR